MDVLSDPDDLSAGPDADPDVADVPLPSGWNDPVHPLNDAPPDILLGELTLMFFEWVNAHKVTDACAKSVYTLFSTLLPADANGGSWAGAQKLLKAIYDQSVVSVELCPNDCVAFYNCKYACHRCPHDLHTNRI